VNVERGRCLELLSWLLVLFDVDQPEHSVGFAMKLEMATHT